MWRFLLALWREQVELMMLFICARIHSPSLCRNLKVIVKFRQLKTLRDATYLKVSWVWKARETRRTNNASMRHQCSLTFLGHQKIHKREEAWQVPPAVWKILTWYSDKRIQLYQASNTSVMNQKLTGKQLYFTSLFKELPRISYQHWTDYAETEASKAAKGGSGQTETTTSHKL